MLVKIALTPQIGVGLARQRALEAYQQSFTLRSEIKSALETRAGVVLEKKIAPHKADAETRQRREFTPAAKARILKKLDAAPPGGKAKIMKAEGIYSAYVGRWRKELSPARSKKR